MFLNYSEIPGQQNLFLDYLYSFDKVKNFYNKNFRDVDSYPSHFQSIIKTEKVHLQTMTQIIKEQYADFHPSFQTLSNIEALKNRNTLAIVTGQQLGIFGGPLYTFYKTITAIKLCNYLRERFNDYNFVPVFWLEGDDHDFNEVNYIKLINDDNEVIKFTYNDPDIQEVNHISVGNLKLSSGINTIIDEINSFLRETEFKPELIKQIKSFYSEGKSFKDSFKELLFHYFDEYGIILFDPQDVKIKNILKPVFKKELLDYRKHTDEIIKRSAKLEEVYHAQVKVNPINLFFNDGDGRYLLEPGEGNEFRLKGKRKKLTFENLLDVVENEPSRFSPNVLLRPICQDYLLPTAVYIGGPSEISYFAQVIPLYKIFGLEHPIIYPRASLTIVEKNIKKVIDKYQLTYNDIFIDKDTLIEKVIRKISDVNIDEEFKRYEDEIHSLTVSLKEKLLSIDNSLEDSTTKTYNKILEGISSLKNKTFEAQKKKHEITIRQLNKVSAIIYPNSNLQERELNYIYFAHKYGTDVIKWIFGEITINRFEHQIIEI